MTVRELLHRIDSRELTEWMAFNDIEPFGEQRDDLRSAIVACTIANAFRSKKSKEFKPMDFMPFVEKPEQTLDQMKLLLQGVVAVHNKGKS